MTDLDANCGNKLPEMLYKCIFDPEREDLARVRNVGEVLVG